MHTCVCVCCTGIELVRYSVRIGFFCSFALLFLSYTFLSFSIPPAYLPLTLLWNKTLLTDFLLLYSMNSFFWALISIYMIRSVNKYINQTKPNYFGIWDHQTYNERGILIIWGSTLCAWLLGWLLWNICVSVWYALYYASCFRPHVNLNPLWALQYLNFSMSWMSNLLAFADVI